MTFPRKLLTDGEDVVVDLRPHWAFLGWPLVATIAAVALAVAVEATVSNLPNGVLYVLLAAIGLTALWLAGRLLRWMTTSLVLTTNRIVERSGVFARRALEIRLDRINELSYHQSLTARLFRTGEVMVEMGGETGVVTFEHVPRPSAFQSLITEQMSARRDGLHRGGPPAAAPMAPAYPTAGAPAPLSDETPPRGTPPLSAGAVSGAGAGAGLSVADRLTQLSELRRRGVVTEAEFEAKKAQLLEQL
ncbi:MAG TPA: PH domain-containing protein [Acidimicrobiales bacterium]|nr:PH domain-containing protein [Acidimicrobiales bacterium]